MQLNYCTKCLPLILLLNNYSYFRKSRNEWTSPFAGWGRNWWVEACSWSPIFGGTISKTVFLGGLLFSSNNVYKNDAIGNLFFITIMTDTKSSCAQVARDGNRITRFLAMLFPKMLSVSSRQWIRWRQSGEFHNPRMWRATILCLSTL